MAKWHRQSVRMSARPPHSDWYRYAYVSPSGRWAVVEGRACGWRVSHVPTGLACVHLECLLRDAKAWCERVDAELGPVLDDAGEDARLVRDVPRRFGLPVRVGGRLVCKPEGQT
jgi:hypothetical protein